MYGYHGCLLHINLTNESIERIPIKESMLRECVGGTGLGTRLLLSLTGTDHLGAKASPYDALAPDAPLLFVFSPLVGSPLTTSAKFAVVAKSPLTHRINDSLSSSHFAIAGKKTGCDALAVTGKSKRWTCLVVEPDSVRFEDAAHLIGCTSRETEEALAEQMGAGFRVASIGPAGERGVKFATISNDGRHAGRGGLGAVMGSKQLKAVAVRGDATVEFAHPRELTAFARDLSRKSFGPATAKYRELGTISNMQTFNRLGSLPTRNFQQATFDGGDRLAPDAIAAGHPRTRASCAACTIGCEHIFTQSNGDAVRIEYESLFALGSLCGIDDPGTVLEGARMCDDLGIDTISAGASIAFAMECAERGLIDTGNLEFGNGAGMLHLLREIGERRGLGETLSLGTRAAAEEIGQGSEEFAPHVKGLEIPGYDPRALQTMALGFAVGTRGADHNRSSAYEVDFSDQVDRMEMAPGTARLAIETENQAVLMDSLILCKFLRGVFDDRLAAMSEMLHLVTGWDVTSGELWSTANRIVDAKKRFNISQGWTPDEDTLPDRFFSLPLPEGASAGAVLSRERMQQLIREYNLGRGWTEDGFLNS